VVAGTGFLASFSGFDPRQVHLVAKPGGVRRAHRQNRIPNNSLYPQKADLTISDRRQEAVYGWWADAAAK